MAKITEPGIYPNIPAEQYHADDLCDTPSLSSSICKTLIFETPQHAWTAHPRLNPDFERDEDAKFSIGNAAHSLMLNDPKTFEIVEADDWRTKAAQERKAAAFKAGKIPLLSKHWKCVSRMVEIGRLQLLSHHDASDAFTKGAPEVTLIWKEGETWFRIRLDWLSEDRRFFDDYKTTESADPDTWSRVVFSVGHDIQAAFYRRGIRALGIARNPHMRFVVQEASEPHALSVIQLAPEVLELADRRVEHAIGRWNWCRKHGKWPGYPAKTITINAPPWHETQMMEREERDAELARGADLPTSELLALANEFHRPI